ncbi:TPA: hypothetical protein ACS70L_003328 [Providencia alcalifaciens]
MHVKVIVAYCVELAKTISIGEAQIYFSAQEGIKQRFNFICSDPSCGVRITGVNYDKTTQDGIKFKAPHFRSHESHSPNCEWVIYSTELYLQKKANETEDDYKERKAKSVLCDRIDYFTPHKYPSCEIKIKKPITTNLITPSQELTNEKEAIISKNKRYISTSLLKRLTDYWLDCKKRLPPEMVKKLKITVDGLGRMQLHRYIKHISALNSNNTEGVFYGGTRNQIKKYGAGFSMTFMDKLNNLPTTLYIDKSLMNNRLSHYINAVLDEKNVKYFKVFILNPILTQKNFNNGDSYISLTVETLDNLSLYYEE